MDKNKISFYKDILLWCSVYNNFCQMPYDEEYPAKCNYCSSLICETNKSCINHLKELAKQRKYKKISRQKLNA